MALNIGAALWVASGGEGRLRCSADSPSAAADGLQYRSQVWTHRVGSAATGYTLMS